VTVARAIALAALAVAAVLVAMLLLGGGDKTSYKLRFQNAGQLVKDNDVQIGGRRIGSVRKINLTDDNQAEIDIEVSDEFAPLRSGTRAVIRATSLSGIANRYIALTPGPNNAKKLEDGAVLPLTDTTTIVDLDQLFNTLDPRLALAAARHRRVGDAVRGQGQGRPTRPPGTSTRRCRARAAWSTRSTATRARSSASSSTAPRR
jgi:phospholipid/cholesterol/gamma-HCH transport system substrate-binding protein